MTDADADADGERTATRDGSDQPADADATADEERPDETGPEEIEPDDPDGERSGEPASDDRRDPSFVGTTRGFGTGSASSWESDQAQDGEPGSGVPTPGAGPVGPRGPAGDGQRQEAGERGSAREAPDAADGPDGAVEAGAETRDASSVRVTTEVETVGIDRWNVGLVLAMVLGGAGILLGNTAVFVSAVVGVAYAVYGSATRPPAVDLVVERELDDASPLPGHDVTATVTLRNEGDRSLPDVRVLDGVPATLGVAAGSPRYCTSLRAGESDSFSYTLATSRGEHEYDETVVVARNVAGSVSRAAHVTLPATVTVDARAGELPPRGQTIPYTGEVATDDGGEGIEFYSTRQYARGDPMKRIDWKRYANTHELRTIDFRVTEAASVVVLVDRRDENRVARAPDERSALDLAAYAGGHVASSLLAGNNRVGVVAYGDEGGYVRPGVGRDQELRIRRLLEEGPAALEGTPAFLSAVGRSRLGGIDRVRRHLPSDAQVVFCSPLLDDDATWAIERLSAYDHRVTVISPDVTGETIGGQLEGFARQERLHELRERGVRAVDWSPDEPLYLAVEHARRRWSR